MAYESREWSFVLLLVGGLLVLVGGLAGALMMGAYGTMGGMAWMMGDWDAGWLMTMAWWMGGLGVACGALILLAAWNVRRGHEVRAWSVVAVVAGAFSLFAMGGWLLGALAAMAGGALGLLDEPSRGAAPPVGR